MPFSNDAGGLIFLLFSDLKAFRQSEAPFHGTGLSPKDTGLRPRLEAIKNRCPQARPAILSDQNLVPKYCLHETAPLPGYTNISC